MKDDGYFLKKAVDEGNTVAPPYNFGAVVVRDGEVIAAGHPRVWEDNDPSAHSEISALRAAGRKLGSYQLDGCTLYASHQPCVMCFACAAWANINRVVYAIPASEVSEIMYEFNGIDLGELSKKLSRPMQVEQVGIGD